MSRVLLLLPLLAACAAPEMPAAPTEPVVFQMDPYSDPEYPRPMGSATAALDGATVEWVTADFSVGAVDPSASINTFEPPHEIRLRGIREAFRRAPPDREIGDIVLNGLTSDPPAPGPLAEPLVEIRPGEWDEGLPILTSRGGEASITIETLDPGDGNDRYGRVTGRFTATLCRAAGRDAPPDRSDCLPVEGRFDTRLYVGNG